ncbi:MAG: hypothetical protein PHX68_01380 [Alphaproteobacteria bacterium]|nr:hypothetical protein [Alphaproteobacteria bacterium]
MTINDNQQSIVRAMAYAWKYRKIYEQDGDVKGIMESEKMGKRTVYKYLNLAYLSPRIINEIMDGQKSINLQELFTIASKHHDPAEQEQAFSTAV